MLVKGALDGFKPLLTFRHSCPEVHHTSLPPIFLAWTRRHLERVAMCGLKYTLKNCFIHIKVNLIMFNILIRLSANLPSQSWELIRINYWTNLLKYPPKNNKKKRGEYSIVHQIAKDKQILENRFGNKESKIYLSERHILYCYNSQWRLHAHRQINSLQPYDAKWWYIWVNIGSCNGLLPDGTNLLPEPILTSHQ